MKFIYGLSGLCFLLGIKELVCAKKYYDAGNKRMAAIELTVGIVACACSLFSITGIV